MKSSYLIYIVNATKAILNLRITMNQIKEEHKKQKSK